MIIFLLLMRCRCRRQSLSS